MNFKLILFFLLMIYSVQQAWVAIDLWSSLNNPIIKIVTFLSILLIVPSLNYLKKQIKVI